MKITEALKISDRIRRPDWANTFYFSLKSESKFVLVRPEDLIADDWEPIIEKKTKQVWQWRFMKFDTSWHLDSQLLDESQAEILFARVSKFEKHAGPFEIEV